MVLPNKVWLGGVPLTSFLTPLLGKELLQTRAPIWGKFPEIP
jgi:hypothetical protein